MNEPIQVIWNPSAGPSVMRSEIQKQLISVLDGKVAIHETKSAEDAFQIVQTTAARAHLIVAAGGDGTFNTVIDSLMRIEERPNLGLLPVGTGNNLCRTLDIPLDPVSAIDILRSGKIKSIDLALVTSATSQTYYANVASGGTSDRVIENLEDVDKQRWGPWCYLRSALPVMAELQGYHTTVRFDESEPEQHQLWNVLVANGKFAAGGLAVGPRADLEGGYLDVMLILDGTPLDLAGLATEFFLGDYLEDERVIYRRAREFYIEAQPELKFLADGEVIEGQPFQFAIQPQVLAVLAPADANDSA